MGFTQQKWGYYWKLPSNHHPWRSMIFPSEVNLHLVRGSGFSNVCHFWWPEVHDTKVMANPMRILISWLTTGWYVFFLPLFDDHFFQIDCKSQVFGQPHAQTSWVPKQWVHHWTSSLIVSYSQIYLESVKLRISLMMMMIMMIVMLLIMVMMTLRMKRT